jgi:hypothetical protein
MTETPIFDQVVGEAVEFDMLPTFEPVIAHEEFLIRHEYHGWLWLQCGGYPTPEGTVQS